MKYELVLQTKWKKPLGDREVHVSQHTKIIDNENGTISILYDDQFDHDIATVKQLIEYGNPGA